MANCESNSIVTLDSNVQSVPVSVSESWQSKYFSREERDFKDEKSGKSGRRLYSVCKPETSDKKPCPAMYVYSRTFGTGNLMRHLRNKHSIEVVKGVLNDATSKVFKNY